LHVHFHVAVLDGVFTREPEAGVVFHPALPPTRDELGQIVRRVQERAHAWLRRHGYHGYMDVTVRPGPHLQRDPPLPSHRPHEKRAQVAGMVVEDGVAVATDWAAWA
jgi:hypothetical protein